MGLPVRGETPDTFQDDIIESVRRLFQDCEDALLPIDRQIKRYKKRDLQASHAERTSRKVFGARQTLFRRHLVDEKPFDHFKPNDFDPLKADFDRDPIPPFHFSYSPAREDMRDQFITDESATDVTEWVENRKRLRDDLNVMGLDISWLERKPQRTCLEESVLSQLKTDHKQKLLISSLEQLDATALKKTVAMAVNKIAQAVLKNNSLMSLLKSPRPLKRHQCTELFEVAKIDDETRNNVLNFYFNKDVKVESFQNAIIEAIKKNKGPNPMITVTPLDGAVENDPSTNTDECHEEAKDKKHADALKEQRKTRLQEYQEVVEGFQSQNLPLNRALLQKVLLHPGDLPRCDKGDSPLRRANNAALLSENFWKVRERKRSRRRRRKESLSSESPDFEDEKPKRTETNQSVIFLPPLRDVLPEKHHMNLSTGRALIGRKIDCWLSAEEYMHLAKSPYALPLERERASPRAFWTNHSLDKSRLWMSAHQSNPRDKARDKGVVFQLVDVRPPNGKRVNQGYNNNELTWPTDGRYVKYGDIDMKKTYQI